jgi:uncharacterized protein YpmB
MILILKKYWLQILLILTIVGITFYFTTCNPQPQNDTVYIHDTTVQTRYEIQLQKDTVTKWYEKVYIKEVKPDTIRYQRVDSVFIESQKDKDLILGFDKKGTDLRIWALNMNKQLLKEQLFTGVYNTFSAYSANDKVVVKTEVWEWNRVKLGYEHKRNVNDLKTFEHSVDVLTGVSFKERISLDAGLEYHLQEKDLKLKGKLTLTIF